MIYQSVLGGVVSALAAESIDNTSKQAWQKLYNSADEDEGGDLVALARSSGVNAIDRMQVDCWVAARLHHVLEQGHWSALVAKYCTHKARKVQALVALQALVTTPAPKLFLYKALTAWAIPQLRGVRPKVLTSVSVSVPLHAPAWRREAMVNAAVAAGRVQVEKDNSRSADMIVLKDSFYDMNTWDLEGRPESTRRRWRADINEKLDGLVADAMECAEQILLAEGLLMESAVVGEELLMISGRQ